MRYKGYIIEVCREGNIDCQNGKFWAAFTDCLGKSKESNNTKNLLLHITKEKGDIIHEHF